VAPAVDAHDIVLLVDLAELRHWLTETEPQQNRRSEVLLRVFFLGVVDRDRAREYLIGLAATMTEEENARKELEQAIDWDEGDLAVYGRIALEYGLRFNGMRREWAAAQIK
jgi:PadR family transcriptional regulator AphA